MADFGQSKEALLRLLVRLEHGIPSHDSRVFRLLKPEAFERAFCRFMAAFAKANGFKLTGVVAVDGNAVRGDYERGGQATPLHLVDVFAVEAGIALAQQKAPGRNETAGALEVLELLSLEGCIVTADALHCHCAFAAAVHERGGDYVLAIKANRGRLFTAVTQQFARSGKRSSAEQIALSSHDRHELRRATIMRNTSLASRYGFPGVAAVGRITSHRYLRVKPADASVVRYLLLSKYISSKQLLHVTRSHWSIENQLHWVLDLAEDKSREKGQCSRKPRPSAQARPRHLASPPRSRLPAAQNQASRLGRCLSLGYSQWLFSIICDSPALTSLNRAPNGASWRLATSHL